MCQSQQKICRTVGMFRSMQRGLAYRKFILFNFPHPLTYGTPATDSKCPSIQTSTKFLGIKKHNRFSHLFFTHYPFCVAFCSF